MSKGVLFDVKAFDDNKRSTLAIYTGTIGSAAKAALICCQGSVALLPRQRGGLGCVAVLLRQLFLFVEVPCNSVLQSCHQRRMCLDRGGEYY